MSRGLIAALACMHGEHWAQVCPMLLITLLIWSAALETKQQQIEAEGSLQ